ncbi:MAG: DUF6261 family protein [Odoribacteraceae bacterium]|jgi:hypothetical protein|nr:DUF6261 family protein [Odoribacteraceae bacterium]
MTQNDEIIIKFHYPSLDNERHVQYHNDVNELVGKYGGPSALGIYVPYAVYGQLYNKEVEALDQIIKSDFTARIAAADHERDRLYRGFAASVKADLNHFDEGKREMARKVGIILDHYGDVPHKSLDAETAAIRDVVRELSTTEHLSLVIGLGLQAFMLEVNNANEAVHGLMLQRYDELALRPALHMREIRVEVDKAFRVVLDLLESLVRVQGPDTDKAFITELNVVSMRYKDILAREAGRRHPVKDLSTGDRAVVETIPVQPYTGAPVIPIPRVYYRGDEKTPTEELVFTRDFTVVYKNNVEVGMAEITISGKGNYKGKIAIPFNIARQ